jgi:hypothetical protein
MMISLSDGPEAIEWLRQNSSATGLLLNRFKDLSEAEEFINRLYAAGAEKVFVPHSNLDQTEYPATAHEQNALVAVLPKEHLKMQAVYDVCLTEQTRGETLPLTSVNNESCVNVDWDE